MKATQSLVWPDKPELTEVEQYTSQCGRYRVSGRRCDSVWRAEFLAFRRVNSTDRPDWYILGEFTSKDGAMARCRAHAEATGWLKTIT